MSDLPLRPYPDFFETNSGLLYHSPAKVNLSLRIVGKRPDGYHDLETVFQELDWYDELEFSDSDGLSLEVVGADLPTDDRNLVLKAAHSLAVSAGVSARAKVRLRKILPLQGGVGGGSSNASITLLALNRLWGLNWPTERLIPLARELGADCPFFLFGGLARATGRGDDVVPVSGAAQGCFVMTIPPFGVETAWAFSQVRLPLTEVEQNVIFSPLWLTGEGDVYPPIIPRNDLENIVFQRYSELERLKECLLRVGASFSMLSGSGSTVYGVFASEEAGARAARELAKSSNFQVKVCRAVARQR